MTAGFRFMRTLAATGAVGCAVFLGLVAPLKAVSDRSLAEGPSQDLWFPVGETIHYKIYWGHIPVADSTASTEWVVHEGRRMLAVRFRTQSNAFLSTIYPVDDFIESIIDPETFLPVQFTKRLKEGRYRCHEVTTFDHDSGTAIMHRPDSGGFKQYEIAGDTRDLVSFMYSMRTESFPIGVEQEFQVMADEKLYDLQVKSLKEEEIHLPRFGPVSSIKLKPTAAFQGLFVRKGEMTLWVSDDDRRLVTKAAIKVPVAHVNLVLDSVTGPGNDEWVNGGTTEVTTRSASRPRSRRQRR